MEINRPINSENFYKINQIVCKTSNWKVALDEIIHFVHTFYIFDNLAIYLFDRNRTNLDVVYAKAMGRGKTGEADVAWGESLANQVVQEARTILQEPPGENKDRLQKPIILGIPLQVEDQIFGTIQIVRFGTPDFTQDQVHYGEFIAGQISLLLKQHQLTEQVESYKDLLNSLQVQEDFLSTLSHELHSPIGYIKGYTTTLLREDTQWNKANQNEFLKIIDQETDNLKDLVENLLDSSRLQSGQIKMNFQIVRLDALLNDAIARAKLHHPRMIFHQSVNPSFKPIMGDARRLAQVFDNLTSNVEKYAPGSPVFIRIEQNDEGTKIFIEDHGPGIPPEHLKHIFERFYRAPNSSSEVHGSGLGLFICKQIIRAHYGSINVKSELNKGTIFEIFLPGNVR